MLEKESIKTCIEKLKNRRGFRKGAVALVAVVLLAALLSWFTLEPVFASTAIKVATANPTMSAGTIAAGTFTDTTGSNNIRMRLNESGSPDALDAKFTSMQAFGEATEDKVSKIEILFEGYNGATSDTWYVQMWDYDSGAWSNTGFSATDLGTLPTAAPDGNVTLTIADPATARRYIGPGGAIQVRILDGAAYGTQGSDWSTNSLYIDYLAVRLTYDNTPPVVGWSGPADGSTHKSPVVLQVTATDSEPDASGMQKVEFYYRAQSGSPAADTSLGTATYNAGSGTWDYTLDPAVITSVYGSKTYVFTAKAYDNYNNISNATRNIILDNTAPVVSSLVYSPNPYSPSLGNMTIQYDLNEVPATSATVSIQIKKADDGSTVKQFGPYSKNNGSNNEIWDGRDSGGQVVPDGNYTVNISAEDTVGNVSSTVTGTFAVDNTTPEITGVSDSPDPFSPNNDSYKETTTILYSISEQSNVTVTVYSGPTLVRTLEDSVNKAAGTYNVSWDGKKDDAGDAPEGTYTYKIDAKDAANSQATQQSGAVYLDRVAPMLSGVSDSPDPYNKVGNVTFNFNLNSSSANVVLNVYNQNSEVVRTVINATYAPGSYSPAWDGKDNGGQLVHDGIYTYKFFADDGANQVAVNGPDTISIDAGPPEITGVSASLGSFSPNGDGSQDTADINYTLSENSTVTIVIYDSGNNPVRTLVNGAARDFGANSEVWNGRNDSNSLVPDGTYTYKIDAYDFLFQNAVQKTGDVVVDTVISNLSGVGDTPDPFAPDGSNFNTISYTVSEGVYVTIKIYNQGSGNLVRTLVNNEYRASGPQDDNWNGKDELFNILADGRYEYRINMVDPAGNSTAQYVGTIDVERLAPFITGQNANPGLFSPNWDGVKDSTTIYFTLSEPAAVWIKVYDGAHTEVKNLVNGVSYGMGTNTVSWDGRDNSLNVVADGSYTFEIQAKDSAGNWSDIAGGAMTVDRTIGTIADLTATDSPNRVDLAWSQTDGDIDEFKIYRSTNSGFTPNDGTNLLATVVGGVYAYSDMTGAANTTYYYKVKAEDQAGNSSISNQASGMPVDVSKPLLLAVEVINKTTFNLVFNEQLKADGSVDDALNYKVEPSLGIITPSLLPNGTAIRLVTQNQQAVGVNYAVYVNPSPDRGNLYVKDLAGNTVAMDTYLVAKPFNPHGPYDQTTEMCAQCHSTHNAAGPALMMQGAVTELCYVCHDGSQSFYNIQAEFTDVTKSVYHPVPTDVMNCVDCHNPHGNPEDGTVFGAVYAKLLRSTVGSTEYYGENSYCLACHGDEDQYASFDRFTSTYWANTGGSHNNPLTPTNRTNSDAEKATGPVHYDNRLNIDGGFANPLNPASGTNATCVNCHDKHSSEYDDLLDSAQTNSEEELCFKCHGNGSAYQDIYTQFFGAGKVSNHEITETDKGRIECSSCHGPHTVDDVPFASSNGSSLSTISNPDNTKQAYTTASGDITGFCLKCHDSAGPAKVTDGSTLVPYDITFSATWTGAPGGFTTNDGKWNKAGPTMSYLDSGHYTNANRLECTNCHDWHGAGYAWLVKYAEDTDTTNGICLRCHDGSYTGAANVKTPLTQTSRHTTLYTSSAHGNTENYNGGISTRHAECYDCHDPHTAKPGTGQVDKLGNVSGVTFNWGTYTWADWSNTTPTAVPLYLDPADNSKNTQAYLCFKCHSKYAYTMVTANGETNLRAPHTNPSNNGTAFNQTDVAREFNPNVKSKHIVIPNQGYINIRSTDGNFTGSWTSGAMSLTRDSVLKCTDCHGPASLTEARGPHGSTNKFILVAPWNPTGGSGVKTGTTGTESHLCFKCHSYSYYTNNNSSSAFNNHGSHSSKGCASCHGGLPHGWKYVSSSGNYGIPMSKQSDPVPYSTGSGLSNFTLRDPDGFSGHGDCSTNC